MDTVWPEELWQMKIPSDTIGNRTRDLTTCSAVPQPTEKYRYRRKRVAEKASPSNKSVENT